MLRLIFSLVLIKTSSALVVLGAEVRAGLGVEVLRLVGVVGVGCWGS